MYTYSKYWGSQTKINNIEIHIDSVQIWRIKIKDFFRRISKGYYKKAFSEVFLKKYNDEKKEKEKFFFSFFGIGIYFH